MDREKVINCLESEIKRAEKSVNDIWLECVEVKLLRDALALIDTQYKLILELQNLIRAGTEMMNGGEVNA